MEQGAALGLDEANGLATLFAAYVALGNDNAVAVLDVESPKPTRRLPAGSDPETFAISPDGRRLYVSNEDAGTASAIDTRTGLVIGTVPVEVEPEGAAVSPAGRRVYVTAETTHTVSVIDAASFQGVATVLAGSRPREVAFAPDGTRAYVTAEIGRMVDVNRRGEEPGDRVREIRRGRCQVEGHRGAPGGDGFTSATAAPTRSQRSTRPRAR